MHFVAADGDKFSGRRGDLRGGLGVGNERDGREKRIDESCAQVSHDGKNSSEERNEVAREKLLNSCEIMRSMER